MNINDNVKFGIYIADGTRIVSIITSRQRAEEFVESITAIDTSNFIAISGTVNDVDCNRIVMTFRRNLISGCEIVEVNNPS